MTTWIRTRYLWCLASGYNSPLSPGSLWVHIIWFVTHLSFSTVYWKSIKIHSTLSLEDSHPHLLALEWWSEAQTPRHLGAQEKQAFRWNRKRKGSRSARGRLHPPRTHHRSAVQLHAWVELSTRGPTLHLPCVLLAMNADGVFMSGNQWKSNSSPMQTAQGSSTTAKLS